MEDNMNIQVNVKTFGPIHQDSEEYKELRETLKDHKRFRVWDLDGKGTVRPGLYDVETKQLFNNQSNTTNLRIFDFADYSMHPDSSRMRYGHYIENLDELNAARDLRHSCGYCGHQADAPTDEWCPKCLGSEYLTPEYYKLLKMQPVSDKSERHAQPPAEVLEEIVVKQAAMTKLKIEKQIQTKFNMLDQKLKDAKLETEFLRECVDRGVGIRHLDNMIFYSHTQRFCFGWRRAIPEAEKASILEKITPILHLYEVDF
jgi:hypothetical protein